MGVGRVLHPLDPLDASEISAAADACKAHAGELSLRFNTITLKEPTKAELLDYDADPSPATTPNRQAFCILQTPPRAGAIEAVVALHGGGAPSAKARVVSWVERSGVQAMATPDDCFEAEAIVKADPGVRALLAEKYGITDLSLVACDPWSVHLPPFPGRLVQTFMYSRGGDARDNAYAHPIDFVPILDLDLKKVVRIDRPYGDAPPPIPSLNVNYHRDLCELPPRGGLKPLDVVQPEGASFRVAGNLIEWQNWRLRVSFNYREGLVLHSVAYRDGAAYRPVLHRASLVEMAVPYAAPQEPFTRKCAFDVGDYGLGNCATSLALGCDCLGHIHYFDAVLNNSRGEPVRVPKAVCLHEEDAGVLWKHVEYRTGHSEVRRNRHLVVSFAATVVNYEYLFYWRLGLDGAISYDIKLTGELSTNALAPGEAALGASAYGTMVSPGVNSQHHQHLFSARLDMAVDDPRGGKGLVVSEVDVQAVPTGADNPAGNAFVVAETPLLSEAQAQRVADPSRGRYWKVSNPASLHPVTCKSVSWKVLAPGGPLLLAAPTSSLAARGAFATRALWVTPHRDEERWPAGDYPMQSEGGEGLAAWTAGDRPCGAGHDPVIWLTLGVTHVARVEDFPVMPVETVGFTLKPFCFFGGNPGVDVPHTANAASSLAGQTACCATSGDGNGVALGTNGHR